MMEMPKPTQAHDVFHKLAGSWTGEETMYPSPWDPAGGKATARMSSRVGVDGFALIGDYEQERGGTVTFRGHSVWSFDKNKSEYVMYWVDSMGMPGEGFRGTLDGSALTMVSHNPMGHAKLTYDVSVPDRIGCRMETSQGGVIWQPMFDSTYVKAPPPPPPPPPPPCTATRAARAPKRVAAKKNPTPKPKPAAMKNPAAKKAPVAKKTPAAKKAKARR